MIVPKLNRKITIIIIILVLLVATGLGYYFFYWRNRVSQNDVDKLTSQSQQLVARGKLSESEQLLVGFYNAHKKMSADKKYQVTLLIANNYLAEQNSQAALDWYKKAEATSKNGLEYATALGIARAAQGVGNNQLAIEYYQKTIDLAKKTPSPQNEVFIEGYQQLIIRLQNPNDPSHQYLSRPANAGQLPQ